MQHSNLQEKPLNPITKGLSNYSRPPRPCYCINPNPKFKAPRAYAEKVDLRTFDVLDEKYKKDITAYYAQIKATKDAESKVTALNNFVARMLRKLKNPKYDIFKNDILVKSRTQATSMRIERRKMIHAIFTQLALYSDLLTGVATKTTVTSLSDQVGATTWGSKRYDIDENKKYSDDDKTGKKKAISRASRALAVMERAGIVTCYQYEDPMTRRPLGKIVQVTDSFYKVLGFKQKQIDEAKANKLKAEQIMDKISKKVTIDDLPGMRENLVAELRGKREEWATNRRRREALIGMSDKELRNQARKDIHFRYGPATIGNWSDSSYEDSIVKRMGMLKRMRADFNLADKWAGPRPCDMFIQ